MKALLRALFAKITSLKLATFLILGFLQELFSCQFWETFKKSHKQLLLTLHAS